jgi:quinol monooxygenase YgiN
VQLSAGLTELASEVEKNESGCLSYQFFYNEAENEFAVFEM